jgi:hypothetical protein
MPTPVPRQEADRQPFDLGEQDVVGRRTPRACNGAPARVLDARQVIEPAAADDAEHGLGHTMYQWSELRVAP